MNPTSFVLLAALFASVSLTKSMEQSVVDTWVLSVAAIAVLLHAAWRDGRRNRRRFCAEAVLSLSVSVVVPAATVWLVVGRDVPIAVSWLVVHLTALVGFDSVLVEGAAIVRMSSELVRVQPSWIDLAAPVAASVIAAVSASCYFNRRIPRTLDVVLVLLSVSLLLIVRNTMLVLVASDAVGFFEARGVELARQISHGWIAMLSASLALLPLRRVVANGHPAPGRARPLTQQYGWAAVSLLCVSLVVTLFASSNAGDSAGYRVLVDDSHIDDWEIAGARFTEDWRGDMSVYSCSSAFEAVGDTYEVSFHRDGPIDTDLLADVDVLVLKVPNRRFQPNEVAAIQEFVRVGGGVVVVGDHTDLFGCNTYLNEVIEPTGMAFRPTGIASWENGQAGMTPELSASWLPREVEKIRWLTGCNMSIPFGATPIVVDRHSYADQAVYANRSFFGDNVCEPNERCGPNVLAAAARYGRGRVVACGDGTVFTNFAVFRPGRYELLRSLLWYASRDARLSGVMVWVLMFAGVLGGLFGASFVLSSSGRLVLLLAASGVLAVTWHGVRALEQNVGDFPAVESRPSASFLGEKAHYFLAPTIGGGLDYEKSYDSLFVEIQRFGITPRWQPSVEKAMEQSEIILIPNVLPRFDSDEIAALTNWVAGGGVLYLGTSNLPGTAEGAAQVLKGVGINPANEPQFHAAESVDAGTVRGWRLGAGWVFHATGAQSFSRSGMGHPFRAPTDETKPKFEVVDAMMGHWAAHCGVVQSSRFVHRAAGS